MFHACGYEQYNLLGYNGRAAREIQPKFQNIFGWLYLPPAFTRVPCSAYSLILKMEEICSSETSIEFERTTRRYIAQGRTLRFLDI
jgi:hypothetical protein